MNRRELLRIGAAGQLLMNGEIEVLPLEDETAYEAANPVSDAETVEIDETLMEARRGRWSDCVYHAWRRALLSNGRW